MPKPLSLPNGARVSAPAAWLSTAPAPDSGGENHRPASRLEIFDMAARARQRESRDQALRLEPGQPAAHGAAAPAELLLVLCRELYAPLQEIRKRCDELQTGPQQAAAIVSAALNGIRLGVLQQERLLHDLVNALELHAGGVRIRKEPVSLGSAVMRAYEDLHGQAEKKALTVQLCFDETEPWVNGDATLLRRIFANLLSNALKFTPPGGLVQIFVRHDAQMASVTVRDSGCGIRTSLLPSICDWLGPRRQISRAGLGLGLATARKLCELHGGSLLAESDGHRRGATFTVRLPVAHHSATKAWIQERSAIAAKQNLDDSSCSNLRR